MKRMLQRLLLALVSAALLCSTAIAEEWIPDAIEPVTETVADWIEPDSPLLALARSDGLIYFEDIDAPLQDFLQTRARCIFETLRPSQLMFRLSWVTDLNLTDYPGTLTDARWLWMFENLTSITLTDAALTDLNVIGGFTGLEQLTLLNCGYFSLLPLENCKKLNSFTLGCDANYTGVSGAFDLSPLAELGKLKTIGLYGDGITDITPLKSAAKQIRELSLSNTAIEDFSIIKKMTRLGTLTLDLLHSTVAADILTNCTKDVKVLTLQELIFNEDVETAAKKYKKLSDYTLIDCDIANPLFYEKMNKATRLTLQRVSISDGTSIGMVYADKTTMILNDVPEAIMIEMLNSRSPNLKTLTIDLETLSEDLNAALRKKTSLNTMTVNLTGNADLTGTVWGRLSLRDLTLASDGKTIQSTDFMSDLTHVSTLTLSGIAVDNTAGIGTLKRLTQLNVYGCRIGNWNFMENLQTLETVKVYGSELTSETLPWFAQLKRLTDLRLDGNQITDISALLASDTIVKLDILNNPIADYAVLLDMPAMRTVYLDEGGVITGNYILARSKYIDDVDYEAIYQAAFGAAETIAE